MAQYGAVKRILLILLSALGCLCAFAGVLSGVGAILQQTGSNEILTIAGKTDTPEKVELPCRVGQTDLIASQLVMYEGPFLEIGGDVPVSDITALILYNSGDREIAQAEVVLTGEEELTFFASHIMPGAKVLVLEKNAAAWQEWSISACDGWVSEETGQSILESALEIREVDMGILSVTNISREKLPEVWLFYKNYLEEGDLYIGGITYIETVGSLDSGETVRINPNHYAAGYSRIIKAEEIG